MRTYSLHNKYDRQELSEMLCNKGYCFGFRGKIFCGADDYERLVAALLLSDPDVMSSDGECISVVSLSKIDSDSSVYRGCIEVMYKLEY